MAGRAESIAASMTRANCTVCTSSGSLPEITRDTSSRVLDELRLVRGVALDRLERSCRALFGERSGA